MAFLHTRLAAGLRRLRPESIHASALAERFGGLSVDLSRGQILAAFKRAAPELGIAPRLRDAIDVLMAYSQPQDWTPDSRPIVWPSNSTLQEQLGLCRRQVQYLIRTLIDKGLIVVVDSPTGRRWGQRHSTTGKIVEAYGFDLSPLAVRYNEFVTAANQARENREARAKLRRRLTIARKAIRQIAETAMEKNLTQEDWQRRVEEAAHIAKRLGADAPLPVLQKAVAELESRRREAENILTAAFPCAAPENSAPSGATDCIPITTTNELPADQSATRRTDLNLSSAHKHAAQPADMPTEPRKNLLLSPCNKTEDSPTERITPRFILTLSPSLKPYIATRNPNWSDIVNAADWVRGDLGINRSTWIEACQAMGRTAAATAIAIIAAKAQEIHSAGAYLRAMSRRARQGDLHLSNSLYGLAERRALA